MAVVDGAIQAGASLQLSKCDASSPSQQFTYAPNGQFQMTSSSNSGDDAVVYCLAVGSEGRYDSYWATDLMLVECETAELALTQWTLDNALVGYPQDDDDDDDDEPEETVELEEYTRAADTIDNVLGDFFG